MMLIPLVVKNRKPEISTDGILDGSYLCRLISLNPNKSIEEYRREYFSKVEEMASHTGMSKNAVHELYKEHIGVETTKSLTTSADWVSFLESFKWYAFSCCDLIL